MVALGRFQVSYTNVTRSSPDAKASICLHLANTHNGIREIIPASGLEIIQHCGYTLASVKAKERLREIGESNTYCSSPIA